MLPMANNGSVLIYHRLIKPFVKKHEKDFDSALGQVGDIAKDVGKQGMFSEINDSVPKDFEKVLY